MALDFNTRVTRNEAIEAAIRSLVTRHSAAGEDVICLPIFHPSGATAAVSVTGGPNLFQVSDGGQAYREVEMIGAEHLFRRNASKCAEDFGVAVTGKVITGTANAGNLAGFIADVAAASAQISARIVERVAARTEAAMEEELYRRLAGIFGENKVVSRAEIAGASSHKWHISALVHLGARDLVFEAVSNHHSSVYSSATMFHDLALLDRKIKPIAVVESKAAMGPYLSILAQAANVIESDATDDVIERLAA